MPLGTLSPIQILKQNRTRAIELASQAGGPRTRALLEKAQRELEERLRQAEGLRGPGADSFTANQVRIALEQVRDVLRSLRRDMRAELMTSGQRAAQQATRGTIDYLQAGEKHFTGSAQPLALKEALMLDRVAQGTESSLLHRISTDPAHPGRQGVLDRYGDAVVGKFEEQLQLRFITKRSWAETRDALVAQSDFLKGAPAHWAERIVRTEVMGSHGRAGWESIRIANQQLGGDMLKVLSATFDHRTAADSYAVHGQIRKPEEAFESWYGLYQHPPNRPNDREVVVPHRAHWPLPSTLKPKSDGEVSSRWVAEGRKGSPPARPLMSTVDLKAFKVPAEETRTAPTLEPARVTVPEQVVATPEAQPVLIDRVVGSYGDHLKQSGVMFNEHDAEKLTKATAAIFGDEPPTTAALERTWGAPEQGFKLAMTYATPTRNEHEGKWEITYRGSVMHEGSRVGDAVRTFIRHDDGKLEVHHDLFKLQSQGQGKGLGESMLRQSIKAYEEIGVDEITVDTAWVGSYTWATFGYNWSEKEAERRNRALAYFLEKRAGVESARAKDIAARVSKNAWDVAALDVDGIEVEIDDPMTMNRRKDKVGKAFLLSNAGWEGAIKLDPKHPTYKRAKERLKL
jgi:hypothetical protein